MDALEQAKQNMAWKEGWREKATYEEDEEMHAHYVEMEDLCRANAVALAAIAQAEALQLIAKRLEQWMSAQGVLPEFFEAVDRARQREE